MNTEIHTISYLCSYNAQAIHYSTITIFYTQRKTIQNVYFNNNNKTLKLLDKIIDEKLQLCQDLARIHS